MGWDVFISSSALPWQTIMKDRNVDPESSPDFRSCFRIQSFSGWPRPRVRSLQPIVLYLQAASALCAALQRRGIRSNYLPAVQRVLLLTAHKKIREVSGDSLAQQPQNTNLPSSTIYQLWPSLKNVSLVSLKFQFGIQPDDTDRLHPLHSHQDIRPLPGPFH
jgi:hypothetical protein